MKKIFFFSSTLVLIGLAAWYFLFRNTDPVAGPGEMVIQGQGEKVVIHDVYQAPSPDKQPVVFNDDRDVIVSDTSQHQALYFAGDQGFLITLTTPDIWAAREEAEKEFLTNLKIDRVTACKLKVSLGVPFSVHEEASGVDYGLSFCPGGRPLPPR